MRDLKNWRQGVSSASVAVAVSSPSLSSSMKMQTFAVAFVFLKMIDASVGESLGSIFVHNPWATPCGLLSHKEFLLIIADRVVTSHGAYPGSMSQAVVYLAGAAVGGRIAAADRHHVDRFPVEKQPQF